MGGRAVFLAALAGLLAAALPRRPWTRSQTAVAVLGAALLLAADTAGSWRGEPLVGRTMAAGVALPALLALGAGLGSAREPGRRAAAALLTAWLAAALALAWGGPGRFLMLLPVPVALAIAALVGRLFEALRETDASGGPPLRGLLLAASLAVPMLLVAGSLYAGRALARLQSPILDRAWSQILHEIRDRSPADAVVTAWWDYGHWIKHRTGRRVLHDGTSLRTPVPFWVARALASEDPDEGLGILRMLHCGSDTRGLVDPPGGAAAELTSLGVAPQRLVPLIRELVSSDRAGAEARLAREGLDAAQRLRVLERTHCSPPPGVLLVNGELAGGEPIRELAAWTAPGETGRVAPTERWLVSRLLADPAPQLPGLERLAEERDSRGQRLRAFSIRWPTPSAP